MFYGDTIIVMMKRSRDGNDDDGDDGGGRRDDDDKGADNSDMMEPHYLLVTTLSPQGNSFVKHLFTFNSPFLRETQSNKYISDNINKFPPCQ